MPKPRGNFARAGDPGAQPKLPDETPGWEARTYTLTLGGCDALNPMTDRWMRFRHTFGPSGQKVLEAFGEGSTIEELGIAHGVELSELQRWVKQWGEEGLVRGGVRGVALTCCPSS